MVSFDLSGAHAAAMTALLVVAPMAAADEPSDTEPFHSLFDGQTLDGWEGDGRFWRVEDGAIVGQTTTEVAAEQNTFLIYRGGSFSDFELRLSYQVQGYNSGVQYRSVDEGDYVVSGYQCDFEAQWHPVKGKPGAAPVDQFTGMFFEEKGRMFLGQRGDAVIVRENKDNAKKPHIEKIGSVGDPVELETHIRRDDWNELIVIANGNQFTHIINGQVMAIGIDEDAANRRDSGLFAFQLHKGPPMMIRVKDIRVRRLNEAGQNTNNADDESAANHNDGAKVDLDALEQFALTHAGNAAKGKQIFLDARTKCAVCHTIDGRGGQVGVDLSRIGGKFDRPHLIESVLEPSRQIVEGYRTSNVLTVDGRVISGIMMRQSDEALTLIDANAKTHFIAKDDVEEISHSIASIMPEGLADELTPDEFTDLIAYLESLRSGVKTKMGSGVAGPISVPDGFTVETIATGIDGATALDVLPDGRVLVCEQTGQIRVIDDGKLMPEPLATFPVDSTWERGVIGVTHAPSFPKEPYIYVCWVAKDPYPHHRISRLTVDANATIANSETVLLIGDDQTKMGGKVPAGHQGGGIHFGKDGKLYIGIGEQTAGTPSQELDTFLGKILRINPDGSIPDDNPLLDRTAGKYQAIWALGCRNPFTFAVRDSDGLMLINDVGGKSEEINVGRAGANYGWPVVEHGDFPEYDDAQYDGPIHWYPQSSVNGGDFCPSDSAWPNSWQGRYFFADFVHGWIHTLDPDHPADVNTFIEGIRRPVDLRFSDDGSLYVLLRNAWVIDDKFQGGTGSLLRVRPTSAASTQKVVLTTSDRPRPTGVHVIEDAVDASAGDLPAFKIQTPMATYYLEKSGGGLSSLVDSDGNDWLGFHPGKGSGAAGEYRGFPNAVFHQGGNYFHARNSQSDPMQTRLVHAGPDYAAVTTESLDGRWQGRYEFYPTHCTFSITRMPNDKHYWILYEGTPGGRLDPDDWWMTSSTPAPKPIDQKHDDDLDAPEWIAFGDASHRQCIVLHSHDDDRWHDSFYAMDDQMTVFGFGRQKLNAYLNTPGRRFSIGLADGKAPRDVSRLVDSMQQSKSSDHPTDSTAPNDSAAAENVIAAVQQPGPKPGDVYREYAIHNGGNFDWRVTDPNASAEGAKKFLPNPVLMLAVKDLEHAIAAEVVLDRWGGHAGTSDKRIRFNGNTWIRLPELSTTPKGHSPEKYHSQDNPVVTLPLDHLIQGENRIEATVGPSNQNHWGQWGLYSLILRVYYDPAAKSHATGRITSPATGSIISDDPLIRVDATKDAERVDVLAWYDGYDENGDGIYQDWHVSRFQPWRGQAADLQNHVGTIDPSIGQHELRWDTHWVPDQTPESIKLVARIHDDDGTIFVTDVVDGLTLSRESVSVRQYRASDVPESFSVRVGKEKSCRISIDPTAPIERAEEAVLHYRTWEASDAHHEPLRLNGHPHRHEGKNHHYDYDLLPIPVGQLRRGDNRFTIRSETQHHMVEVLWPGPAITVRYAAPLQ
ncbi:Soluble aldose sugar dehydrogenase YliI precursor [Crateriforma conspicua]|uniref:Soluble aldose sugar dehydrogenase YliI n=2 Tax=Planctomycetaceae TaxID=126 RepID=A0A5C6FJ65_9PLAN|nr:Soluble aldose sugar dehydrogenase YliI precursor [Crateriforma conspicua]